MALYKIKSNTNQYVNRIFASGMPILSKTPKIWNSPTFVNKAMDKLEDWVLKHEEMNSTFITDKFGTNLTFNIETIED